MKKPINFVIIAFFAAFLVRCVPEILMGSYLSGFDQLGYYVPIVYDWLENGINLLDFIASAPLLYSLLVLSTKFGLPLIGTLKLLAPLLHGFLAVSIYVYSWKSLRWSCKKSLYVALLATLYYVGLRTSWDMLRVQLGLIFLFGALTFMNFKGAKSRLFSSLFFLLVVFSNQYVAVIALSILFLRMLKHLFNKEYSDLFHMLSMFVPSLIAFVLSIYANTFLSSTFLLKHVSFPALTENAWLGLFGFSSYFDLVLDTGFFVIFCYIFILPFVGFGFRKLKSYELKFWTLFGCLAAFFPLFFSISRYRWVLLLIYPFAFYFVEGASALKRKINSIFFKIVVFILLFLSVSFVILPAEYSFPYYTFFNNYVPTSMLQNTVPLSDCDDLEQTLNWINDNIPTNSCVISHTVFYGWEKLFLNDCIPIITYGYDSPDEIAESQFNNGFSSVLLIWWVNGSGLHGQPTISGVFREIFRINKIAVYDYCPFDDYSG